MRALREMITKYNYEKYVKGPNYSANLIGGMRKMRLFQIIHQSGNFKPKYGVHTPNGISISEILSKPYTIHFWRDLVTKKYKLSLDAKYSEDSLWEILIKRIDGRVVIGIGLRLGLETGLEQIGALLKK